MPKKRFGPSQCLYSFFPLIDCDFTNLITTLVMKHSIVISTKTTMQLILRIINKYQTRVHASIIGKAVSLGNLEISRVLRSVAGGNVV
jgi:hypothetical protein